jgi:hypothetical protein
MAKVDPITPTQQSQAMAARHGSPPPPEPAQPQAPEPTKKQIEAGISGIPMTHRFESYRPLPGKQKDDLAEVFKVEFKNAFETKLDKYIKDKDGDLIRQKYTETATNETTAGTSGADVKTGGQVQVESSIRPNGAAERDAASIRAGGQFARNVGDDIRIYTVDIRHNRSTSRFVRKEPLTEDAATYILSVVRERAQAEARRAFEISINAK